MMILEKNEKKQKSPILPLAIILWNLLQIIKMMPFSIRMNESPDYKLR